MARLGISKVVTLRRAVRGFAPADAPEPECARAKDAFFSLQHFSQTVLPAIEAKPSLSEAAGMS
jgi:hypothetical protein